jgi:hypothetical protein
MKQIVTSILAAGALALAGYPTAHAQSTTDSQKSAIESVYAQRAQIVRKKPVTVQGGQAVAQLMGIDVRRCPANFRSAWFDYLVKVQEMHTRMKRVAEIASVVGKPVKDVASLIRFAAASAEIRRYLLAELGALDDAWGKVERAGMSYGVMPSAAKAPTTTRP